MADSKQQQQASSQAETTTGSVLDAIIEQTPNTKPDEAKALYASLVEEALKGQATWDKDVTRTIKGAMKRIDEAVSKQLAAIMHHKDFQKVEGTWRGLNYLVMNSETSTSLKIRVLNVKKDDLRKDLEKAVEFDQSELFKKIYENEFGTPGGEPYGALIGDYDFENTPDDMGMLTKLSGVAAAAFAPFISSASPKLFGLDSYSQLSQPRDLAKIFDTKAYVEWRSFRASEDSRFVSLTMPRTLARIPFGQGQFEKRIDEFDFNEIEYRENGTAKPVPHDHYCWMNTAYVMGTKLTDAFSKTGFCTAIRGAENGGKVENLPTHIFKTDAGDDDQKCPTEIAITDRREKELSDLGFLPLCHYKNTDYSVFFGGQSAQKHKQYEGPNGSEATANAAISARLPYLFAISRITHFVKCIVRDKIGSFKEGADMESFLHTWIHNYVTSDANASEEVRARYPLREARVEVKEIPGKPGSYNAVMHLRPWLQLEELTTSMRLVASLPNTGG